MAPLDTAPRPAAESLAEAELYSAESPRAAGRTPNGRFAPGHSGNPNGKRPSTLNWATRIRAVLRAGEDATLVRSAVDRANEGDRVFLRFCVERLVPKPRRGGIELDLSDEAVGSPRAVLDAAMISLATGKLAPEDALAVVRFLAQRRDKILAWAGDSEEMSAVVPAGLSKQAEPAAAEIAPTPEAEAATEQDTPPAPPPAAPSAADHLQTACKSTQTPERPQNASERTRAPSDVLSDEGAPTRLAA
jgi:hypothetical protein